MKRIVILFLIVLPFLTQAQSVTVPFVSEGYFSVDYWDMKYGNSTQFVQIKPYTRDRMTAYARYLSQQVRDSSRLFRDDLEQIFLDNNEWLYSTTYPTTLTGPAKLVNESSEALAIQSQSHPDYARSRKPVLKKLYRTPAHMVEINQKDFYLRLNPILQFKVWSGEDEALFINQRGVQLRGGIDDRIYFYSRILETQARFAGYVRDYFDTYSTLPGAGNVKIYKPNFFDIENGYDYLNAQGYVGFNVSRHVGMQMGYGRNFIGHGYRSMFLSDFSNNYFYFRVNTQFGKFHYQNLYTELAADSPNAPSGDVFLPKKYMVAHYLTFKPRNNLSFGIFETVVFERDRFELHYLNPVILYRAVESSLNSSDNVLLGLDARWNIWKRFALYGQVLFDEFKFDELFLDGNGWWGNKIAVQLGAKYIDAFNIEQLNLQVEYNSARPYTYTHADTTSSYTHSLQPLAHPLGANFEEILLALNYRPHPRWRIQARLFLAQKGQDMDGINYGGNILLPNNTRQADYGNETGQGLNNDLTLAAFDLTFRLAPNLFVDANFQRRSSTLGDADAVTETFIGGGLRWNIEPIRFEF